MTIDKIPNHSHNGVDNIKIDPRDLRGFPLFADTPTHTGKQGEVVLVDNEVDTRQICAYLNGTWYCATLS